MNLEQCIPSFGASINYYASLNMQNLTLNYTCMAETQLSTTLHLTKRTSVWVCEMQGSKWRVFCQAKTAEEEKQLLENAGLKSTRDSTKWVTEYYACPKGTKLRTCTYHFHYANIIFICPNISFNPNSSKLRKNSQSRVEIRRSRVEIRRSRLEIRRSRVEIRRSRLEIRRSRVEIRRSGS